MCPCRTPWYRILIGVNWWRSTFIGFVFVFKSNLWHKQINRNRNHSARRFGRWAWSGFEMACQSTYRQYIENTKNQCQKAQLLKINFHFHFQSGTLNTAKNAYKKYLSTRPVASADANKRVKSISFNMIPALHDFNEYLFGSKADEKKDVLITELLSKMQTYRPSGVRRPFIYELEHTQLLFITFLP